MFKDDIPNYQNLSNTAHAYYASIPSAFWNQLYELFRYPEYKTSQRKWIIEQCAAYVSFQTTAGWKEENLQSDARDIVRLLQETVSQGNLNILFDCLKHFLTPPTFTVQDLNQFLQKNQIGYIYDDKNEKWSTSHMGEKKIFISHAYLDKEYVKAFVEFLEDIGMKKEQIFCSSVHEYGIPLGCDIYEYLRSQFFEYDTRVIYMLSSNYYNSVACLHEMGASWILKKDYTTILLPGFEYKEIKGAINAGRIALKLDNEEAFDRLAELAKTFLDQFSLPPMEERIYKRYVREFLKKCEHI